MTATRESRQSSTGASHNVGLLLLRVIPGLGLIVHGVQKLFGWVGGPGIDGFAQQLASHGYPAPRVFSILTAVTEVGAGALLVFGLLTPLAAAAVIGVMVNAIVSLHIPDGFWETTGDRAVVYGVVAVTLAFTGPGALALDRGRWARGGMGVAATSIGLGIVAAIVTLVIRAVA